MSKFIKNLVKDAEGIKLQRATSLSKETADAQIDLIRGLEKEQRELENQLMNLTDLSPDNAFDLKPGGKNYNATQWVAKMQEIQVALLEVKIQLGVATKTQTEWFSDNGTED